MRLILDPPCIGISGIGIGFEDEHGDTNIRVGVRISSSLKIDEIKKAIEMLIVATTRPTNPNFKPCVIKKGRYRPRSQITLSGNEMKLSDYNTVVGMKYIFDHENDVDNDRGMLFGSD